MVESGTFAIPRAFSVGKIFFEAQILLPKSPSTDSADSLVIG